MQTSKSDGNQSGVAARKAALRLILGVLEERVPLSDQLAAPKGPLALLPPPEKARAQRLASDTLRYLRRSDQMLGPFLRLVPVPVVHNILRMATVELLAHGTAAHGVVSDAVTLTHSEAPEGKSPGLVNAVLRKVARLDPAQWREADPPRMPKPLRKRLVAAYGNKTVIEFERAHAQGALLDLTLKDGSVTDWYGQDVTATLPSGSVRLASGAQVSALPGYEDGSWWVQDVAAALPVRLLDPGNGRKALDLCAAPGGKTLQLAAAGFDVTAVDISESRLNRLRENLNRTGLTAQVVASDALEYRGGPFDVVLLDAPCSATGTIRRHPDLPYVKNFSDLSGLTELQARLMDSAAGLVCNDGILLFATCSLLSEEGEAQTVAFLERNPRFKQFELTEKAKEFGSDESWSAPGGALRLRPDFWQEFGGMDGFYIAGFRKSADD